MAVGDAEELQEQLSDVRRTLVLALVVWPIFGVLDVFGTNIWNGGHGVSTVISLRVATTVLLAAVYIVVRVVGLSLWSLAALDLGLNAVLGIMVASVGLFFHGGLPSRDFAGVIILVSVRAGMYPTHWKRVLVAALLVTLTWPATIAMGSLFVPALRAQWASRLAVSEFSYGMIFAVFSVGMFVAGSHTLWAVRREVRVKSRELAENRAELASKVAQLESTNVQLNRLNEELAVSNHRADRIFTALAEALPGSILDGKYQLRDRIGAGGFGVVFRATHLLMRRPVAVKVFRPTPGNDSAQALERFRREAISACLVQHPNAVTIYDSGISGDQIPYLAMELLEGESLAALLQREKKLDLRRCLSIALPVCDALDVAHGQGIVHRDVKPENVFLHQAGGEETVKVVDFGIAALIHTTDMATVANQLTATNVVIGTPAYVAPERVVGDEYDGRVDVYSVGVMIYEMLTGHLPIENEARAVGLAAFVRQATQAATPLRDWLPEVPDQLEAVVMRTLARDPAKRPTAAELGGELRRLLERGSVLLRATAGTA